MKIGIFSKFDITGGSELRCVELANGIVNYTPHQAFLLGEGKIADRLKTYIDPSVRVFPHVFRPEPQNLDRLYEIDSLLIVNTDSKLYTTYNYWIGQSEKHKAYFDLTRLKQITYLFNYIISPASTLTEIELYCPNVKIITANTKFFKEIPMKYSNIVHIPRMTLESPINEKLISQNKIKSHKLRLGMYSKPQDDKWNENMDTLIQAVNESLGESNIEWYFMGCPERIKESTKNIPNVRCYNEFEVTIKEFLANLDVFVFFSSLKREEPWSRVAAEAMLSGTPVIATNRGGNSDQIIHGNTGFLCTSATDFALYIATLYKNRALLENMRRMCIKNSQNYVTKSVIQRLMNFLED